MAIHPGDDLAGYRVTRLLGRGGMGEVWAAVDERRERRDVAIKVLLARAAMKPDLVRRFEREARIAASIQSPFVCQLLEVATSKEGAHLLVFEHLTGESLADRLKREQYLPLSEVGPILDDVLQGLAAAHAARVIHRDLKPGNIFLEQVGGPERQERAKILDFGISKMSGKRKDEPTLTAFDATLGSFAYMAPEQVRGAARADERADIYAVGAVAFRALSGRLPFEGTTAAVLVSLKLDRNPPSLEEATGEKWPAGVERFLERALARVPESRFGGALEALEAWRSIQPNHLTRHIPSPRSSTDSYSAPHVIQDDATEVDNPPTMTVDGTWSGREILEVRQPDLPQRPPVPRPQFGPPSNAPPAHGSQAHGAQRPAPPASRPATSQPAPSRPAQSHPAQSHPAPSHPALAHPPLARHGVPAFGAPPPAAPNRPPGRGGTAPSLPKIPASPRIPQRLPQAPATPPRGAPQQQHQPPPQSPQHAPQHSPQGAPQGSPQTTPDGRDSDPTGRRRSGRTSGGR